MPQELHVGRKCQREGGIPFRNESGIILLLSI